LARKNKIPMRTTLELDKVKKKITKEECFADVPFLLPFFIIYLYTINDHLVHSAFPWTSGVTYKEKKKKIPPLPDGKPCIIL